MRVRVASASALFSFSSPPRSASVVLAVAVALAVPAAGCGGDDDVAPDAGGGGHIEDLPVDAQISIDGLEGPVEVVQDDRGMHHIYAASLPDAVRVEGYLMARDRMGQMEIVRRLAEGRLAEIAGSLDASLIESDTEARFVGHLRNARAIYATLPDRDRALLDAYAAGVNAFIAELRDGRSRLARGVEDSLPLELVTDWEPIDTLAIARFQAAALSFDALDDVKMSEIRAAAHAAFPATSPDPVIAARARVFTDLCAFAPTRDVFTADGFPNDATDTGSRALRRPPRAPSERQRPPARAVLANARRFLEGVERLFEHAFGDDSRGSNAWLVSGSKTASGNALLANDPHLSLTSPPLFWYVHIDTQRMGGDVDVEGLALAGTPVVLLGFNDSLRVGVDHARLRRRRRLSRDDHAGRRRRARHGPLRRRPGPD